MHSTIIILIYLQHQIISTSAAPNSIMETNVWTCIYYVVLCLAKSQRVSECDDLEFFLLPLFVHWLRCPRNLAVCLSLSKTMFEFMLVNKIYIELLEIYSSKLSRSFIAFWTCRVYLFIPLTRGCVYLHSRSQSRVWPVITSKLPRDLSQITNQCFTDSYRIV